MVGVEARGYPRAVTHAELRARLRAYAEGTLVEVEAEAVRVHLAGGCEECLRDVFDRPAGLPRPRPVVVAAPPRRGGPIVGLVAAAAGLGVLAGSLIMARRQAPPAVSDDVDRATAAEIANLRSERSMLSDKVKALEDQVAGAGTRAQAVEQELERTRERLAEVEKRMAEPAPPSPPRSAPQAESETPPAWLDELLSSSGARAAPFRAAPFARDARGYALWSPARGLVVVTASGLLPGDALVTYRVRVLLSDGSEVWVDDLGATERGILNVTVALRGLAGRRAVAVDLYRDPPGRPALTAKLRP